MKPLTRYGLFMYNLCEKTGLFLSRHVWLYWLIMFTWALPTTIIGLFATLGLLIIGKKPERYGHTYRFVVSDHWGGLTLYPMFIQDKTAGEGTSRHEYGHLHQLILGPFFFLLVGIPSATRYWIRTIFKNKQHAPYDQIWFERSATDLGSLIITGKRVH